MSSEKSAYEAPRSRRWLRILIVTATILIVIAAFFLEKAAFHETRRSAAAQFNQEQLTLARAAASGIEARYREISNVLSASASSLQFHDMAPECLLRMQEGNEAYSPLSSLRVLDANGILRFIYPFEGWRRELIGRDYSDEVYFQELMATGQARSCAVVTNEQGERRIRIAIPLYQRPESGQDKTAHTLGFEGVAVGSFDPHLFFDEFLSDIRSGKSGYVWGAGPGWPHTGTQRADIYRSKYL